MPPVTDENVPLVSLADVADLAEVTRPAVSNWRRRHADFPQPVQETGAVSLFRWDEIQGWLARHGKRQVAPSARQWVWRALNAVRGSTTIAHAVEMCLRVLGMYVLNGWVDESGRLRATYGAGDDPVSLVKDAARVVGEWSVGRPLEISDSDAREAALVVAELPRLVREHGTVAICEAFLAEASQRQGRAAIQYVTPPTVAELVVELAAPIKGLIYDPACGWGNFLLAAYQKRLPDAFVHLVGDDVDQDAWLTAALRMLIHGVSGAVGRQDGACAVTSRQADLVFTDPPFEKNDTEWSWIDRTINHLNADGQGFHVSRRGLLFRGGQNAEARRRLVRQGSVEAVITLPPGLYGGSSIPTAMWLLRRPSKLPSHDVLLIDASRLGARGRLQNELRQSDVRQIAASHRAWRERRDLPRMDDMPCVAVSAETLLDGDCQLSVRHWQQVTLTPEQQVTRVRAAGSQLGAAAATLSMTEPPHLVVAAPPSRRMIRALVDDRQAELIRGIRVPRELIGSGSTPILRRDDLRDCWEVAPSATVDLDDLGRDAPLSRPGDILVVVEKGGINAAVDTEGGAVLSAPLQCLRVREPSMDLSLVIAAVLSASTNGKGALPSYADIRDLDIPWPDNKAAAAIARMLREFMAKRAAAAAAAIAADELINAAVDAFATGALPANDGPHETVVPR